MIYHLQRNAGKCDCTLAVLYAIMVKNRESKSKVEIQQFFRQYPKVAVAFSGGVDSAVLLLLAKRYAKAVKAYYVASQFQPAFEKEDALQVARQLGVETEVLTADVLARAEIAANPADRCYYCKKMLFHAILNAAQEAGFSVVAEGTNASDDVAERPGYRALQEAGVLSPLRACGLTKADIRRIAEQNRLPVAHKPSYACLATRIPTGTRITPVLLQTTETAENALRGMGFQNFRIRYRGGAAKLELGKNEKKLWTDNRAQIKKLLLNYYTDVVCEQKERADE